MTQTPEQTATPDLPPPLPDHAGIEEVKAYIESLTSYITVSAKAIKNGAEIELEGLDTAIEQGVDAQKRIGAIGADEIQPAMDDMLDRLEYLADILREHAGEN